MPQHIATTEHAEPLPSFYSQPVFGGASLLQLGALLVVGAAWSGLVWLITDRVKYGIGVTKPYSPRARFGLTFVPLAASVALCMAAFPLTLALVGISPIDTSLVVFLSAVSGVASWATAKGAHDAWGQVLSAAVEGIKTRLKQLGGQPTNDTDTHGL